MADAQIIRIHAHGGAEVMRHERMEVGQPGEGEILIAQHAIGVNFLDVYHRRGGFPIGNIPGALGVEAAGEVIAAGPGAGFSVGERVAYAGPPIGAYASHRIMPARSVVRLPASLSFEDAASIMLKGMTAHMLFSRVTRLSAGDTILVHAAAGGLGSIVTQWGKALGLTVIGTVGTPEKADIARQQGCDAVILYRDTDFVAETRRLTGDAGVDAVFEGIGGNTLLRSLDCLKPFGLAVNLGQADGPLPTVDLASLGPQRSLGVVVPGVFAHLRTSPNLQAAADEMFAMFTAGRIAVKTGHRFALSETVEAHRLLEAGRSTGSIVLVP